MTTGKMAESDSGHIKFGVQTKDFYYCEECEENIPKAKFQLAIHFYSNAKKHTFRKNCVHCRQPVYDYMDEDKKLSYCLCDA